MNDGHFNPIKIRITYLIVLIIAIASCMNPGATYKYADGNGNSYLISESLLRYIPVSTQESSSGIYSGGDAADFELSAEEYNQLAALFEQALATVEDHQKDREMMTGMVSRTNNGEMTVVLRRNSNVKERIEEKLSELKGMN